VHADLPALVKGKAGRSFKVNVPVFFHVVTDGSIGNLTDAQITAQIDVLNLTFGGGEGGVDTGFKFRLAGVTRTDNAAWFYGDPGGNDEHSMKRALQQSGADTLNLYSTTAGPYLGWAYLPSIVTKPGQAYLKGVVIDWESMLGTSTTYAGRYDHGETATHEVGHGSISSTPFTGAATRRGISWTTRRRKKPRPRVARQGRTRARNLASTRSTTTWTTRTTTVTPTSRRARHSG
jgi:hypothetical protein